MDDEPCLHGEIYPVLVQVWDNKNDDIYDTPWFTAGELGEVIE